MDEINVEQIGNRFNVLVSTRAPADRVCAQVLVPFEEIVSLDVAGLPAGDYEVVVNDMTGQFTLSMDNTPVTEPPPIQTGTSSLNGTVWHDLCGIPGGEGGAPTEPSDGCIEVGDGYQANGILDPGEPGLEGVILNLGSGPCPSVGILTTLTDANGMYQFNDLLAGTYCVSIDTGNRVNEPILMPGMWTTPETTEIIVELPVEIGENETVSDVNFGWDFQFLPAPEDTADCTDQISFIKDVSYPDNTGVAAGGSFVKTWQLMNDGTCTWGPEYDLVFVKGEQLGGAIASPLTDTVAPGEPVDISIQLEAPKANGTYQGFWQLQNPDGDRFGFGEEAETPFWVLIIVNETTDGADLGKPTWQDTFTDGANWPLFDDDQGQFSVDEGKLSMTAKNPDWWNSWMLTRRNVENFQLEIIATPGECAGFDHYGLIFRAPDASEGYLFSVTCDGRYALRVWDGETMVNLTEWTADKAIKPGSGQTNHLRVKAEGEQLTLYVNDIELEILIDSTYLEGRFGLSIGSTATENFTVEIEQISQWELE